MRTALTSRLLRKRGGVVEPSEPIAPRYIGATTSTGQVAPSTFTIDVGDVEPVTKLKEQLQTFIGDGGTFFEYYPELVTELEANNFPTDVNEYEITEPLGIKVIGYNTSYGDMKIEFSNYANLKQNSKFVVYYAAYSGEVLEDGTYAEINQASFDSSVDSAGNILMGIKGETLKNMAEECGAIMILSLKNAS